MSDELIEYNGMTIPKKHFRVFVYGKDDAVKLVESWDQYQSCLAGGEWFDSISEIESYGKPLMPVLTRKRGKKS